MGNLQGFEKGFTNSKIASAKVMSDTPGNAQTMVSWGNKDNTNVGMASKTIAAVNPTSDLSQNPRAGQAPQANGDVPMVPSTKGGASGDGPTPGYTGTGAGVAELNGSHGNNAKRSLTYGN